MTLLECWGFSPGMFALGMEPPCYEQAKQPLEKPHVCILATAPGQISANNHHQLARLWVKEALDDFSPQALSIWSWMWQRWAIPIKSQPHCLFLSKHCHYFKLLTFGEVCYTAKDNATCLYSSDWQKFQRTVTPMVGWDFVKKLWSNNHKCSEMILGAHSDRWWNTANAQPCFPHD